MQRVLPILTVLLLFVTTSAQERAFDVFNFGIDRNEALRLAHSNGYREDTFTESGSWCASVTVAEPAYYHCAIHDDLVFVYFRFDENWDNLYLVRVSNKSGAVDVIEALKSRLGEPHETAREDECLKNTWRQGVLLYEAFEPAEPGGFGFLCKEVFITHIELRDALVDRLSRESAVQAEHERREQERQAEDLQNRF